jgi:uncharacterized membrane protein
VADPGAASADEETIRVAHPLRVAEIGRSRSHGRRDGLALAFILIIMDPSGIATLIDHGGSQAIPVFVGTLVLTFAIAATLTGMVFMMMEDT